MGIKVTIDSKGMVDTVGAYNGLFQLEGGRAAAPVFITSSQTLSAGNYAHVISGAANVALALPFTPENGQQYLLNSVNTFTVSLTGTNPAHTINGLTTAVNALTTINQVAVYFAGPANMWFTK